MEIRNPKGLICMDGTEYDDETPKELIDETSELWDGTNEDHTNTLITKNVLRDFANKWKQVEDLSETDQEAAKELMSSFVDIPNAILHFIISQVIYNSDGMYGSNSQWLIYNAETMVPTFYDLDSIFGGHGYGIVAYEGNSITGSITPYMMLRELYADELKKFYKDMRDRGIIETEYVMSFINDWTDRIGYDALKRNIDMRNDNNMDIPSYRDSKLNEEYWSTSYSTGSEITYDPDTTYNSGDVCYYGQKHYYKFTCRKTCQGVPPLSGFYNNERPEFGYYNTPDRIRKWLDNHIAYLDGIYL